MNIITQVIWYAGSLHPVHSSIGAGKGWPLITTFDSDTNTISIALIALYNNVQSSTRRLCSWHDAPLFKGSVVLPWLSIGVDRVMHRAISITLSGVKSSTPPCTNQQFCYCSERDARFWSKQWHHRLNIVLANQRAYRPRPSLYLHQWASCLVVRGVIEVGYQHNYMVDVNTDTDHWPHILYSFLRSKYKGMDLWNNGSIFGHCLLLPVPIVIQC